MKKVVYYILITIVLISFSFNDIQVMADTDTGVIISDCSVNTEGSIYQGQDFILKLTFQNITDNDIKNAYMIINSKSYRMKSGSSSIKIGDMTKNGTSDPIPVNLIYNGGNETDLPIKIIYNEVGAGRKETTSIVSTINAVPNGEVAPPQDTSKNKPVLSIMSDSIPEGNAGSEIKIPIKIANTSKYSAVNVVVTPVLAEGNETLPFNVSNLNLSKYIDFINIKDYEQITYNFQVSPDAAEKIYPLKLNFTYKNRSGDSFTSTEVIYIKIKNSNSSPKLIVDKIKTSSNIIKAGDKTELSLDIKNTGNSEAKDIKISLQGMKEAGFAVNDGTNVKYLNKISGYGTETLKYNLQADSNIVGGSHPLTAKIEYKIMGDKAMTEEQQVFLWVDSGNASNLIISDVQSPKTGVAPNEVFHISFSVKNIGMGSSKNVKVSVSGGEQIVPVSQSVQSIQELKPSEKADFNFTMQPIDGAASKNYPISIEVQYDGKAGEKEGVQTIKQYVGVYVDKTGGKGVPKIIIDKYNCEPSIVKAGENFDMNVSFLNTNGSKEIRNIKIYLTVNESTNESGSVFTPVDSSNTFYIDEIAPKSSVEKKLTMYTIPNAKPKTYTLTANFEYEDSDGKEYKSTELIGIPVAQPSKIQIGEIVLPEAAFVGQPAPISAEFYNLGKVQVSNLMIKAEGDFQIKNNSKFVGNFDTGSNDIFEIEVIPTKEGQCKGRLTFSYDEPNGEHKEISKEFNINVMQAPPQSEMSKEALEQIAKSKKKKKNKIIIISVVILSATVTGGIVIRKRRIKKKGMTFDE